MKRLGIRTTRSAFYDRSKYVYESQGYIDILRRCKKTLLPKKRDNLSKIMKHNEYSIILHAVAVYATEINTSDIQYKRRYGIRLKLYMNEKCSSKTEN